MNIVIEKNVPLPSRGKGMSDYPLDQMEIGDSFAVEKSKRNTLQNQIKRFYKENPDKLFTSRLMENTVVRVWRVK
jgi:hypothetical protein